MSSSVTTCQVCGYVSEPGAAIQPCSRGDCPHQKPAPVFCSDLTTAEVGQTVIYNYAGFDDVSRSARVERTTKTIIVVRGESFDRRGYLKGYRDPYSRSARIYPATLETATKADMGFKRHNALRAIDRARWSKLPTEKLLEIAAIAKGTIEPIAP